VAFAVSKELNGEKAMKETEELETIFTSILNSDIMQDEILNHLETDKNGSFNIKMNQNDELVPRDCRSG
jgi:hypothetical protein